MNIKFKRLISFILVITMLLTMPGCATIDGRPASFFEVVIWLVGGILQMTALVVGELVLFVIFAVIDFVMRGIESVTGGDWWVVEDAGGPIMRGYGRLIDPNGRFTDWSEDPVITAPEGTTPATVPTGTQPATESTEAQTGGLPDTGVWGEYTIHFEPNGGSVQTTDGGVLLDQQVPKYTLLSWWPKPPKVSDKVPIRWGYRFLGWGLTPDAVITTYAPKMSLKGLDQSMTLYAMWAECTEHKYIVNEVEDNKILCKDCHTPIPTSVLKFSVFLHYYYPGKTLKNMKESEKQEAVDQYILTKTLMTRDELSDVIEFVTWEQAKEMKPFEKVALANDIFSKALNAVTAQDTDTVFFLNFTAMCIAMDDIKSENLSAKVLSFIDDAGTASSAVEFMTCSMDARKKAESYKTAKSMGIEYTYYQEQAYRDLVAANAASIAKLMEFMGNYCSMSLDAPLPDVDDLVAKLQAQAEDQRLIDIYRALHLPFGNITHSASEQSVNDVLGNCGIAGRFPNPKNFAENEPDEKIIAAMKQGPRAEDIREVIPYIVARANKDDKPKMAAALWYYYGWRLQYDYECFIQDIYNDRI